MARRPESVARALFFLLVACGARAVPLDPDAEAGDTLALIQQKMEPRRARGLAGAQLAQDRAAAAAEQAPGGLFDPTDCKASPDLCAPPFECQKLEQPEVDKWLSKGWAYDGLANFRTWCLDTRYEPYFSRCAAGDIAGAGLVQYELTTAGVYGPDVAELDGSYCFMDGHCVNSEVTNDTTIEEAAAMCDKRFGRDAWTRFGSALAPLEDRIGYGTEEISGHLHDGFTDPKQTRPYMLAACAMGNYHCDVLYCKNYCKNDYFVNKYGHLLKKFGWVK